MSLFQFPTNETGCKQTEKNRCLFFSVCSIFFSLLFVLCFLIVPRVSLKKIGNKTQVEEICIRFQAWFQKLLWRLGCAKQPLCSLSGTEGSQIEEESDNTESHNGTQ
jgi:hypothetical protein